MQKVEICYSLDTDYVEQAAVSIASVLKNSRVDEKISISILDSGLKDSDKEDLLFLKHIKDFEINFIKVDKDDFKNCPMLKNKDKKFKDYHVTLPTYFRFKLPDYLPDVKKILYLDCDVIVRDSLQEIFNIDINKYSAAMICDVESKSEAERLKLKKYFNAGVMLINIEYWKNNAIKDKLFDYASKHKDEILWQDQDVLNAVLSDTVKELDSVWNYQYFLYDNPDNNKLMKCKILHLAGRFKPWLMPFEHPVYDSYYEYLSFTKRKNKEILYRQESSGRRLKNNAGGSTTNILLTAYDEDIQNVYKEITVNYNRIDEIEKDLVGKLDIKGSEINEIYKYISDNNKYTENVISNLESKIKEFHDKIISDFKSETDEKIAEIYDSVEKNRKNINHVILQKETEAKKVNDLKFDKVASKINDVRTDLGLQIENNALKSGEYFEKLCSDLKNVKGDFKSDIKYVADMAKKDSDNLLNKVYDEIKLTSKSLEKSILESSVKNIGETDKKLDKVYREISKNYDYVKESVGAVKGELIERTDSEIKNINDTVRRISDKMNITVENLKNSFNDDSSNIKNDLDYYKIRQESEINLIKNNIDDTNRNMTESIGKLNNEILKNLEYIEFFVRTVEEKQNKKISDTVCALQSQIDVLSGRISDTGLDLNNKIVDSVSKLNDQISGINSYLENKIINDINLSSSQTEEKINNIKSAWRNKFQDYYNDLTSELNKKHNEIYSLTNNIASEVYKNTGEMISSKEQNLLNRIYEIYGKTDGLNERLNELQSEIQNVSQNISGNDIQYYVDKKLEEFNNERISELNELGIVFENIINNQRITYERKLEQTEERIKKLEDLINKKDEGIISKITKKIVKS